MTNLQPAAKEFLVEVRCDLYESVIKLEFASELLGRFCSYGIDGSNAEYLAAIMDGCHSAIELCIEDLKKRIEVIPDAEKYAARRAGQGYTKS